MTEEKEGRDLRQKAEEKSARKIGKPITAPPKIHPVEELAAAKNIESWELAGLMRAAGWAQGKQVSEDEFDLALGGFRKRPQGGGRISRR